MGTERKKAFNTAQQPEAVDLLPGVVRYANFSERWYRVAKLEAAGTDGNKSLRKEILSAASFLESYIFEWARSLAFDRLDEYFPPLPRFQVDPRFKRSLKNKWKQIPAELYADKIIPLCPQLKLGPLGKLMRYRHRLIHGKASRPATSRTAKKKAPTPAFGELDLIAAGWALGVAQQLVLELHRQLGTPPPAYVEPAA